VTLKYTIGMSCPGYSWTEAHYNSYTGSPGDPQSILLGANLANARVACLANACQITRIRISSVPANRLVWDIFPPFIASKGQFFLGQPLPNASNFNAMIPGGVLLVDLFSGGFGQTRIYLGGVPSGVFTLPGIANAGYDLSGAPGFDVALATYMSYLTATTQGWGFLSAAQFEETIKAPASQGLVTNAQYPGSVGIVTQSGQLGLQPPNTQVMVRGWRRLSLRSPALGGVYRTLGQTLIAAGPPATWTYFLQSTGTVQPSNFYTLGNIAVYNAAFLNYNRWYVVAATTRKRGASFGRRRGRSSIRI
jgi:hypothetical protein